uniref:RNase H type-1 domain-containing protein n=1 Tax=Quercus lobata TaxID=97700 RepID=A0A7N2LUQ1_QUELO
MRDKNLTRSGSATEFKKIENQDLYVDGAVFSKRKQVGIGVIIRDSASMVIAALSRRLALPLGALKIEAKAMEVGVQFAMDVGVRDVMLEGDSMCICNALQGMGEASSSVQNYCFFP